MFIRPVARWSLPLVLLHVAACDPSSPDRDVPDDVDAADDVAADTASDTTDDVVPDTAAETSDDTGGPDTVEDADDTAPDDVAPDTTPDATDDTDAGEGSAEGPPDPVWSTLQDVLADSARPPTFAFDGGFPTVLAGSWPVEGETAVDRAQSFLTAHADLYPIQDEDLAIRVGRVESTGTDEYVSMIQTYRGLPVHNGNLVVNLDSAGVFLVAGRLLTADIELDTAPHITARDAEQLARTAMDVPGAPVQGRTRLVVVDTGIYGAGLPMAPQLAWRVTLPTATVLIHAIDGSTIETEPTVVDAFDLDLMDVNGEPPPQPGGACWYLDTTADDDAANEEGIFPEYEGDEQVEQTWIHYARAHEFFESRFGLVSYDGDGAQYEVYVHSGGEPNASYNFGCDTFHYHDQYTGAYDIVIHEVTHAVIHASSGLIYKNESGALNESYADIFGAFAHNTWLIGEDAPVGAIRSFETPEDFGDPFHYGDYRVISDDNGGVHTNSSIANHAFYMMSVGSAASGRAGSVRQVIERVPRDRLIQLYYATMRALPNSSTLRHAAEATIARAASWAASGTHGFTARNVCDIRNAFEWVRLAPGDLDCDGVADVSDLDDDADGVFDQFDNCPLIENPSQSDVDSDRLGDRCDDDMDNDGVPNRLDNCQSRPNPGQELTSSRLSLACCCDIDLDTVSDDLDNCEFDFNPDQEDEDLDTIGDVCDVDPDDDGLQTEDDNCPFVANPGQEDTDGDYIGDACDPCADVSEPGGAWSMGIPELGIEPKPLTPDTDGDGVPDACDDNPFGAGIAVFAGRETLGPADPIRPTGAAERFAVTGSAGDVIRLPIRPCEDCPEYFGSGDGVDLLIDGLPSTAVVWISDEFGASRDRAQGASSGFTVPPVRIGSRVSNEAELQLNLLLLPGFSGNASFNLTSSAR